MKALQDDAFGYTIQSAGAAGELVLEKCKSSSAGEYRKAPAAACIVVNSYVNACSSLRKICKKFMFTNKITRYLNSFDNCWGY